jgi:hypothetical protein
MPPRDRSDAHLRNGSVTPDVVRIMSVRGVDRLRGYGLGRSQPRMPDSSGARRLSWWRELAFVAVIYAAYDLTRGLGDGSIAEAVTNGRLFMHWEQVLHLDPEHTLNQAVHGVTFLAVLSSYFYSTMHFAVTLAVLVWMYRRHAAQYRFARSALAMSTVLGLIGFWLVPTAPPRLIAGSGIRDTLADVSRWGWWGGEGSVPRGLGSLSNQFAAMPSLHVGWALWCGVLLVCYSSSRIVKTLGALYPIATSVVVMATGNHYLLDVLAGVLVVSLGTALAWTLRAVRRRLHARRAMALALAAPHEAFGGEHDRLIAACRSGRDLR